MNICEIFYSIQGESTFAGLPCIFIRLSGCNLRCQYCDTAYSYEPGTEYTIDRILHEIKQYNCKLVLITGGEPLLQADTIPLMERLNSAGYKILLETNGSLSIEQVPSFVHIIIDVKLPGSGHPDSFLPENTKWLKQDWDEVKFVISDKADFDTAIDLVTTLELRNYSLLFSPVTDKLIPADLADWIKDFEIPVRLNLQLHKIIWHKDTRGV